MHGTIPTKRFIPFTEELANLPGLISVFPLSRVVLLQGEVLPLHIFEPRYRAMVRDALDGNQVIGVVEYLADPNASTAENPPLKPLGCIGYIAHHTELPDGRYLLWLLGLERFTIDEEVAVDTSYRQVRVTYNPISESAELLAGLQPVRTELRQALPRLVDIDDDDRGILVEQLCEISDSQLIALACQILELPIGLKRRLLEADNQVDRLMLVVEELYRHLDEHPGAGGDLPETLN